MMKNKTKKTKRVGYKATKQKMTVNKFKFAAGIFSGTYWIFDVTEKLDFMFDITNLALGALV